MPLLSPSFRRFAPRPPRGRRGVALVIVLGLLALLLITTVTFTISMRVERNAASHQRHASIARTFAKTALAQAIAFIDRDIADNGGEVIWNRGDSGDDLTYSYSVDYGENKGRSYTLFRDTLVSTDEYSQKTNGLGYVGTLSSVDAEQFIAPGLRFKTIATGLYGSFGNIHRPEWIPIYDGQGGGEGSIIGRAAFMAFNTSSSLNANLIGKEDRAAGMSPREIAIPANADTSSVDENIADILGFGLPAYYRDFLKSEIVDKTKFTAHRNTVGSYETLSSLLENDGVGKDWDAIKGEGQAFSALDVFSYTIHTNFFEYPTFDTDGNISGLKREPCADISLPVSGTVALSGQASQKVITDNKKAVLLSLVNTLAGKSYETLSQANTTEKRNAVVLYNALLDYVDNDDEMSADTCADAIGNGVTSGGDVLKYARPVSENMPLFSGAYVKVTVKREAVKDGDGNPTGEFKYQATYTPKVFGMYPFMTTCPDGYDVHVRGAIKSRGMSGEWRKLVQDADGEPLEWSLTMNSFEGQSHVDDEAEGDELASAELVTTQTGDILPPLKFDLFFAAQTKGKGKILRSIPADSAGYNDDLWDLEDILVVHVDFEKDGYTSKITATNPEFTRYYWVEALDPAYAYSGMYTGTEREMRVFYRPSVDANERWEDDKLLASVKKLKTVDGFSGISSRIDSTSGRPKFSGGLGPAARTILESPKAARALGLNFDGFSFRNDAEGDAYDPIGYQTRRFVRNGNLTSPGELAFLAVGPWQTLRLYDHGDYFAPDVKRFPYAAIPKHNDRHYHDLVDRFSVVPSGGAQGFVDVRSASPRSMEALKAFTYVFNSLPIGLPGKEASGKRVSTPNAARLAALLLKNTPCYRLSDMALLYDLDYSMLDEIVKETASNGQNYGEFEREALIRNSCSLFSTRGNTFTILMRAESYSPTLYYKSTMGGNPNSSVVAIAQIWRDTVKDENGQYPVLVQFFKILGN